MDRITEFKRLFSDHENFVYYGLRKAKVKKAEQLVQEYHTLCKKSFEDKKLYTDERASLSMKVLDLVEQLTDEQIDDVLFSIYSFNTVTPQ